MVRRIVVPLDHSQRAKAMLPLATVIAQAAYAELILLSVVPDKMWFDRYIGADVSEAAGVSETYLSHLVGQLADRSVPAQHVLLRGDPAEQIVQFAACNDVDLIAMATHGRNAVDRWSFGSVADTVIRTSSVPVLVSRVPAANLERDVALRQQILIPLDGSPHSESCIPYALEVADEEQVDLIAMATHARSGFKRFVMGSVATQVLQDSHVPLMLVSDAAVKHRSDRNQYERTCRAVEAH